MLFKASLDSLSKIITVIFVVLIIVFISIILFTPDAEVYVLLFPIAVLAVTLFITYFYQPLQYELNSEGVYIHRRINKFFIPRNEIKSVQGVTDAEMGMAWRLMGNGGLFGYTGYFYSTKQGKMRWFATRRKHYVSVITQSGKKYILTPDDVDGFVSDMK